MKGPFLNWVSLADRGPEQEGLGLLPRGVFLTAFSKHRDLHKCRVRNEQGTLFVWFSNGDQCCKC